MATFKKLKSGKWQAQVARDGVRRARSFPTKAAARDWAVRQEFLITEGDSASGPSGTLGDLLDRYAREVSPTKRGARWEIARLERMKKDELAKIELKDLSSADFGAWRDRRLREVAPGSVLRELRLLSSLLNTAMREWGEISENYLDGVRRPTAPPPRDRRVSDDEIAALTGLAGPLSRQKGRAVHAFRFAIETGMRAGEILSLTPDLVDLDRRVAHLPMTKNGSARDVPLSAAALALLAELPETEGPLFDINSANLDTLFRRVRDKAEIKDLRFHDSRHEAVTRLAKKLDVLALARMIGHKDIKMLQIYYNESAEDIALLLD